MMKRPQRKDIEKRKGLLSVVGSEKDTNKEIRKGF